MRDLQNFLSLLNFAIISGETFKKRYTKLYEICKSTRNFERKIILKNLLTLGPTGVVCWRCNSVVPGNSIYCPATQTVQNRLVSFFCFFVF